ncbi:MAG: hypothetical protein JKY67_07825 [Pseudomonadales bacterium]|nr:hypothetical protein [Pseudomonadales bacterium]
MPNQRKPRVGIIADTSFLRHIVSHAIESEGYEVVVNTAPDCIDFGLVRSDTLDVWLVELEDQDQWADMVDELLEHVRAPIFFGDGQAPAQTSLQFPRWQRRIFTKLNDIVCRSSCTAQQVDVVDIIQDSELSEEATEVSTKVSTKDSIVTNPIVNDPKSKELISKELISKEPIVKNSTVKTTPKVFSSRAKGEVPDQIWVLGASLGGPASVKLFLDQLPRGLPIAFVLAQHIDSGFQEVLAQVLGRHNSFNVSVAENHQYLSAGDVVIVPVSFVIQFTQEGEIVVTDELWNGPYAPSIDQVMLSVVSVFGEKSGAIIFSGMGDDGSVAGPQMQNLGGVVWAQSADSCANSSQPDSIRDTGCISFNGTPQALAFQLVERIRQERRQRETCGQ